MARLASVQIAGYYPTPRELLSSFSSTLQWVEGLDGSRYFSLLDPCAGDGEAIVTLRDHWLEQSGLNRWNLTIVANELEAGRARDLSERLGPCDESLRGDAFHLHWGKDEARATVLFLNPPYDHDPHERRLEHKFLRRFTQALHPSLGILMYLIPAPTLAVSAEFLSRNFLDLRAWRLPDPHFDVFRQVLVVGRRVPTPLPPNTLEKTLVRWGEDPGALPVLPERCPDPILVDASPETTYPLWMSSERLDLGQLLTHFRPWNGTPTGVEHSVHDLLGARFHTAVPPKPAHIALALSSGMFNGHRLEPNDPRRDPPILAKGRFERELVELSERYNAEGDLTGTVHVEQPQLRLTVLRLDTYAYTELEPGVYPSGSDDPAEWTAADLIERYDRSLAKLLAEQFPPLHDPANPEHRLALPQLARKPFRIQAEAVQAMLKLLAQGMNPFLIAEVGTGKTTMSLITAAALSPDYREATCRELRRLGFSTEHLPTVRRTLVLAPPHLMQSWSDEIDAVLPGSRVVILRTPADLEREADIYLLSRETAKLGHRYRGLSGKCSGCGGPIATSASKNASRRLRCEHTKRRPTNLFAELSEILAQSLAPACPRNGLVQTLLPYRLRAGDPKTPARPVNLEGIHSLLRRVLAGLPEIKDSYAGAWQLIAVASMLARILDLQQQTARELEAFAEATEISWNLAQHCRNTAEDLRQDLAPPAHLRDQLLDLLGRFYGGATWSESETCSEPLFQAVDKPRRYPLARLILQRYRTKFDLVVADEIQEYSSSRSAQTHAFHRLASLPNVPTLSLTGSLMAGYASSLFPSFWLLSRPFREEFERSEKGAFVNRYGYRKLFVSATEKTLPASDYGAQSDRRLGGRIQNLGEAPGVLPTFLMRHLLPTSVLVHKADLDEELPPIDETPLPVAIGEDSLDHELLDEYQRLQNLLLDRIRSDRFVAGRSGKLLGAFLELPSYLDRATDDQGIFQLAYPEKIGGEVIATARSFPSTYRTPKERWLLDELRKRLRNDEKTLLFVRHTGTAALPQRLLRLIESELRVKAAWLDVAKVPTHKRQAWINRHVLKAGVRVLLVNPEAVKTGLNNLVSFSSAVWFEPTYSALTYRQANGRIHRIGQTRPVSVLVPFYPSTAQEVAVDLVARKVTASLQVDGLDLQAALEAAGASEESDASIRSAMQLGEAVYRALVEKKVA